MRYCCYFPANSWPGLVQICLLESDRIPEPFRAKGLGTAAAFFRKARAKAGVHAQPRPGFGDEAFFDLSALHVLAGNAYLIVSAIVSKDGMNTENDESALETLARKALARLR